MKRGPMTRFRLAYALTLMTAFACSSEDATSSTSMPADGGTTDAKQGPADGSTGGDDGAAKPDASDASTGPDAAKTGETCVGYGAGDTCQTEQGKPFGYVCFGGPPPGIDGCKETRTSGSLGNNYCCSENDCVEQIDQSAQCNGVSGKPRRVQCPPTGDGGSNVAPPAGCVEHNSGSTALEKLYCCP